MELNIGKLLVASGVIDKQQLRRALLFQDEHPHMPLGSVVVHLQIATRDQVEKAAANQRLLMGSSKPTPEDLAQMVDELAARSRELTLALEMMTQLLHKA